MSRHFSSWTSASVQRYRVRDIHSGMVMFLLLSTGAAYTKAFRCSTGKKSRWLKSGEHGGHAMGPTVPIHRSQYVLLRIHRTERLRCAGPSHMHAFVLWLPVIQFPVDLADHVRGKLGSGLPVSRCGKTCGPTNQSPTIPAYTLMLNCCWCLEWVTPWGFSSAPGAGCEYWWCHLYRNVCDT
jgi:hypothetical protein